MLATFILDVELELRFVVLNTGLFGYPQLNLSHVNFSS